MATSKKKAFLHTQTWKGKDKDLFWGYGLIISNDGSIYMGNHENGTYNGFGRLITSDGEFQMGWWKNGRPIGNFRIYNQNHELQEQGWYEGKEGRIGEMKEDSIDYKYWEMKQEYFVKSMFVHEK